MHDSCVRVCAIIVALEIMAAGMPARSEDAPDPAPADPPKLWEASFAAGLSLRAGDESRFTASGDAMLKRIWTSDSLTLRVLGDYGRSDGNTDTENYGSNLAWRHDFTGRLFWLSSTGVDSDPVQGRNLRVTVDSGPGYRVWEGGEVRFFDVSSGVGYRHEKFRRGEPENNLIDIRAGYEYRDEIGGVMEVKHKSDAFIPTNDFEAFLLKSELILSVPLVGGLHFRNHARYEFVNDPADDNVEHNFWLTVGLEYRL